MPEGSVCSEGGLQGVRIGCAIAKKSVPPAKVVGNDCSPKKPSGVGFIEPPPLPDMAFFIKVGVISI
jgi:hypothetical protein